MKFTRIYLPSLVVILFIQLVACSNTDKNTVDEKQNVEELNKEIKSNKDWQQNSDLIAREYFTKLYPNCKMENMTVATNWEDNFLKVSVVEQPSSDSDLQASKLILVFQRPMGILRVEEIKHTWKCKNRAAFSAEPCSE